MGGRLTPDYSPLESASEAASRAARASSKKRDTKPELTLRRALYARGLRYRVDCPDLPGRPDIVFRGARVVVFVDGDFWHGRDLEARVAKLESGHNAPYWVAKIRGNVERDRRHDSALSALGWKVFRFWETNIARDAAGAAEQVRQEVRGRPSA